MKKSTLAVLAIILVIVVGATIFGPAFTQKKRVRQSSTTSVQSELDASRASRQTQWNAMLPRQVSNGGFVSSSACTECHKDQFDSWHDTFHRTMTQVADTKTVVAPFDDVQLESRGRHYTLTRESGSFFITMADPDWEASAMANGVDLEKAYPPIVKREIVMTTGSHHMQSYWVASKRRNMLRQIPWTYLIEDKRWVPREDIFIEPPDSDRHFVVWNDNCIVCHAVGGTPNFDLEKLTIATEVAELGISCEACHGPGAPHIAFQSADKEKRSGIDPVVNPGKGDPKISREVCGQCHSFFSPHNSDAFGKDGYQYRAGGDLQASHNMKSYSKALEQHSTFELGSYWTDGTCRVAGREYTALIESPCVKNGPMTCTSCHSMHKSKPDDQLADRMETNDACVQCHTNLTGDRIAEHTHHAADSSGSLCYNCHMPHTSYGVMKAMRSHRVQSPQVVAKEQSDQPNACNLCHLDKTLAWTATKLTEWYQQPVIELEGDEKDVSAALIWMLRGDAVQRAVTAWHMDWKPALEASGDQWQTPFLAQLLTDDYSAVRYRASKSLKRYAEFAKLEYDFVGSIADRQRAKLKTIEFWTADSRGDFKDNSAPILIDSQTGQLNTEKLNELLRRQDKRPILLPE